MGNNFKKIECPRCGQYNPQEARYCMYCGERLVNHSKNNGLTTSSTISKKLNINVLYFLLASLILAGTVILYFAGVFNSPEIVIDNNTKNNFFNENKSGGKTKTTDSSSPQVIDLKTLQMLKNLEKSIEKNPNNTDAMVTLGNKYFDFGHFNEAIKFYSMYLEKLPKSPNVLVDLGVCYYNLKNYEKALKYMKKAVSINPKHQIAYFNLGVVSEAMGEIDAAKKYWEQAIKINPKSQFGQRAQSFLNNY